MSEIETICRQIEADANNGYEQVLLGQAKIENSLRRFPLLPQGTKVEVVENYKGEKRKHICYIAAGEAKFHNGRIIAKYQYHAAGIEGQNTLRPYYMIGPAVVAIRPL